MPEKITTRAVVHVPTDTLFTAESSGIQIPNPDTP